MTNVSTHQERHFKRTEMLRDIVIGMSDGFSAPCGVFQTILIGGPAAAAAFAIARMIR